MTEQRSDSASSDPQHSATLATTDNACVHTWEMGDGFWWNCACGAATTHPLAPQDSTPCQGSFFAYDGEGHARGICAHCERDADEHEFDLPQDDE